MIAIIDYGVGNLFSLKSSLAALGLPSQVIADPSLIQQASHLILPGVGAFGDARQKLFQSGLDKILRQQAKQGKPILGVCLGMQLLFEESFEFGHHEGLGLIPGQIRGLKEALKQDGFDYKIPHMGWNKLDIHKPECPLIDAKKENQYFYYVHSFYAANCQDNLVASSEYGICVPGVVQHNNVFGAQFHPEKSGTDGLAMLQAFAEVKPC